MPLTKQAKIKVEGELSMLCYAYLAGKDKDFWLASFSGFRLFINRFAPDLPEYLTEDLFNQWRNEYAEKR